MLSQYNSGEALAVATM